MEFSILFINLCAYFKIARSVKKTVKEGTMDVRGVYYGGDAAGGQGTAYVNAGNALAD